MQHLRIKCKKEKHYERVGFALTQNAVEYYRPGEGKPIIVCGTTDKKKIEKILEDFNLDEKAKVKLKGPDYEGALAQQPLSDLGEVEDDLDR